MASINIAKGRIVLMEFFEYTRTNNNTDNNMASPQNDGNIRKDCNISIFVVLEKIMTRATPSGQSDG
jgi:hypothetical protein